MNKRSEAVLNPAAVPPGAAEACYAGLPRDAQLEYKAILANASIGIAFTRERKFFLCNPRFAEMLGWKPGELIGQPGEVVYPSRASYEALGAIAIPILGAGRQLDVEWEVRRKDGSTFLAHLIAKAVNPVDAQNGTVWIAEDITERKRQADEVERLLFEQNAILNNASIGICFVRERKVVRCNRRFEAQHGYDPGELDGKPTEQLYASGEDYASVGDAYETLASGRTYSATMLTRRKDGSTYWSRVTGSAVDPANPARGSVWLDADITDQKGAEVELQRVLAEQRALTNNVMVGIAFTRERKVARCNERFEELFGYAPGEAIGMSVREVYFTDDQYEKAGQNYAELDAGRANTREHWMRRRDGTGFWCRVSGRAVEPGNTAKGYVWLFEDVTDRKRADEELQRVVREQELILSNATVGIGFARERVLQRCNPRLEEMFGYAPGELIGRPSVVLFESEQEHERATAALYAQLATGTTYVAERRMLRKDGSPIWCKEIARAIDPADPQEGAIVIFDDITAEHAAREALERMVADRTQALVAANRLLEGEISDRRQAETRAQHLADHDPLTGLPNRRLLEDRLTQAIARGDRNQKPTAVMFVDMDRFKTVNDTMGHAVGDLLLKEVAVRLVKQLRLGDTVCRIGGDEFVLVLHEITRPSDAANVAQKIIETMALPFTTEAHELQTTVSIGISVFPDDGRDAETLIRNADAAMYHAKETGRAGFQFFTEQMNLAASRRLAIEGDLRRAVLDNALRLHYQPIVEANSGNVIGYESLLRWQHPTRGVLLPAEFMPLAEDTGLILRIGEWVLHEACRWIGRVEDAHAVPVSVNLSARQFVDPRLLDQVASALKAAGTPARLLHLEVSEGTAMLHAEVAQATLRKLKDLGVSLTLDNFGSAFSNAANLRRFSLDRLKIDRALIAESMSEQSAEGVIRAIADLAHALGLKVVAEGVETDAQRELLKRCGCDYMQGFLFGRPALAEAAAPAQAQEPRP